MSIGIGRLGSIDAVEVQEGEELTLRQLLAQQQLKVGKNEELRDLSGNKFEDLDEMAMDGETYVIGEKVKSAGQ